jgi:hypothetical protein
MARTAMQDEKLNALYEKRARVEDDIMTSPNSYECFEDCPGWVEVNAEIEAMISIDGDPDSEEGKLLLLGVRTKVLHDRLFLEDYLRGCQCSKFVEAFGIGLSCYYCEENARIMAEKGVELVF